MKKFRLYISFTLLTFSIGILQGQVTRVDSLKQLYFNQIKNPNEKVEIAFKIAEQYRNSKFLDSALRYVNVALEISGENKLDHRIQYYDLAGQIHFKSGSNLLASRFFKEGWTLAQASGDKKKIARLSNSAGISYASSGDFEKALEAFYEALSIFQEFGMEKQALSAKKNIANLLGKLYKTDKALALLKEINIESRQKGLNRMACKVELMEAKHYEELLLYDEAEQKLLSALNLANSKNYLERISCYERLGRIYVKTNRIQKASEFLSQGLVLAEESKRPHLVSSLHQAFGDFHYAQKDFPKAITAYQRALSYTDTTQASRLLELYKYLAETYGKNKDFEEAYLFGDKANIIQQNLFALENAKHLADLEANFAFEEKIRRLQELEAAEKFNYIRFWAISAVLFLTLLALVFAINMYRVKQSVNKRLEAHNSKIRIQNDLLEEQSVAIQTQNKQLVQTNQDLEYFAYAASHDLREPLRTMISYIGLIKNRFGDGEAGEFMDYVILGGRRMEALLDDLLSYSRAGRSEGMELINLKEILNDVCAGLEVSIKENDAKITYETLFDVMGMRSDLHLLFQNLISNAIKFHKPGVPPIVLIKARKRKDSIVVSIKDNGIGIPARYKEKIFAVFQRLHPRAEYEGTGIGLAICKKIVSHLDGEIWFESEEGKGTTFFVQFKQQL